jgi:hypothetical protein
MQILEWRGRKAAVWTSKPGRKAPRGGGIPQPGSPAGTGLRPHLDPEGTSTCRTSHYAVLTPGLGNCTYTTSLYIEPVTFTSPHGPNPLNMQVTYSTNPAYQWGSAAILCAYAGYPLKAILGTPVTACAARTGICNLTAGSQMAITVTSGSATYHFASADDRRASGADVLRNRLHDSRRNN